MNESLADSDVWLGRLDAVAGELERALVRVEAEQVAALTAQLWRCVSTITESAVADAQFRQRARQHLLATAKLREHVEQLAGTLVAATDRAARQSLRKFVGDSGIDMRA